MTLVAFLVWLRDSWIGKATAAALAVAAAIFVVRRDAYRDGQRDSKRDAENADSERAREIRNRVDASRRRGLRDDDDRGYRD